VRACSQAMPCACLGAWASCDLMKGGHLGGLWATTPVAHLVYLAPWVPEAQRATRQCEGVCPSTGRSLPLVPTGRANWT
jgi:hypothetical protein